MFKRIRNFFWFCAGANKRILEEYDIDHNKYFAIGATIFFTAVFAAISAGYAMYFVFSGSDNAILIAVIFGVIWGLTIFNIDRFLVLSIKKEDNKLKEIWYALPRLLLAIMIGIVIARPLELKIFEKEINEGLKTFYIDNQAELINEKIKNFEQEIQADIDKLKQKRAEFVKAKKEYEEAKRLREEEFFGKLNGRSTGIPGWGKQTKQRKKEEDEKKKIMDNLRKEIEKLENKITEKRKKAGLDNVTRLDNKTLDSLVKNAGFFDRNKILGQISAWPFHKKKNIEPLKTTIPLKTKIKNDSLNTAVQSVSMINNSDIQNFGERNITNKNSRITKSRFDGGEDKTVFFISLLFIIIEILPVVTKIMTHRGIYDEILEYEKDKIYFIKRHELIAQRELVRSMALAQREVLRKAIEKWKQDELNDENIKQKYINSND